MTPVLCATPTCRKKLIYHLEGIYEALVWCRYCKTFTMLDTRNPTHEVVKSFVKRATA